MTTKQQIAKEDTVSLRLALISAIFIVAIMGALVGALSYFNQQRQRAVIEKYTQETQQFIENNTDHLTRLFTQTMDECQRIIEYPSNPDTRYYQEVFCDAAKVQVDGLNKEGISDFSAVAFLRYNNPKIGLIKASGDFAYGPSLSNAYFLSYSRDDNTSLKNHLTTGKDIPMWQDFISYIPQKEVLIPFKKDGQIVGYIFRGVLER